MEYVKLEISKLKDLYPNVYSIYNKADELTTQIKTDVFDLLAIVDACLHGDQDWELHILFFDGNE